MGGRILIVGGGIAGLTLAAALSGGSHEVDLIERAPGWALVGAGIGIGVNGMTAMARLGLADAITARGQPLSAWEILTLAGRRLHRFDFGPIAARHGVNSVSIHRAHLHEVLLAATGGARIRMGTSLAALDLLDDGVLARFTDGMEARYDLVVGADGIRSQVRDLIFGPCALTYSGQTSFRCLVERAPGLEGLVEIWGVDGRIGVSSINDAETYCYVTLLAEEGEELSPEGNLDLFRRTFAEFGEPFRHVYDRVLRPEQLIRTDIHELIDHPWTRGRVVLIGDAAHAITPNLGQGGVMAILDAVALADRLGADPDWDAALEAFVAARLGPVRATQERSRLFGQLAHIVGEPDLATFRDTLVGTYGYDLMRRIVMGQYD
ncbi:FAD-dependent monooxygenase [Phenylobacterium sp.]|uniref:FAD-dependent monooxygenase n=1 Tax=Phenylobacterium sp. TaxID=1871053 RepID=UPI00301E3D7E